MRVLFLNKYSDMGASSRLRVSQYIPELPDNIDAHISYLFDDDLVSFKLNKYERALKVIYLYFIRFLTLFTVFRYDLIFIQSEIFPKLPATIERLLRVLRVKYVVDYDDAIFHNYDTKRNRSRVHRFFLSKKIDVVMKNSHRVVCGNDYLASRAKSSGANDVVVIPTVVDHTRYSIKQHEIKEQIIIGWMGSPSTQKYLRNVLPALKKLSDEFNIKLVVVGATPSFDLEGVPLEVLPWEEAKESYHINLFDVGIMPLDDGLWEKGKCGYKLIQYMACGIPVVSSAVGVNPEIIDYSRSGFVCNDNNEWFTALRSLCLKKHLRVELGQNGRSAVINKYSLEAQKESFLSALS